MKKNLSIALVCLSFISSAQNFIWTTKHSTANDEIAKSISCDTLGNVYVTGNYNSTLVIGSNTLTPMGSTDCFVSKYDGQGNVVWAHSIASSGFDNGYGIASDKAGNVYLCGGFQNTLNVLTNTYVTAGSTDAYIIKFNANGIFQWGVTVGSTGVDLAKAITTDDSSNVYVTGAFSGTVNFSGTSIICAGTSDAFIAKYNSQGNLKWVRNTGATTAAQGDAICVDKLYNVFITGWFQNSLNLGNTITSNGGQDMFVTKINPFANFTWANSGGGVSFGEGGTGIGTDLSGNVFVAGSFYGPAAYGTTTLNGNGGTGADIYLIKYAGNGIQNWVQEDGGVLPDRAYGLTVDEFGNSFVTGFFSQSATFGTLTINGNVEDIFVAKYNTIGNATWAIMAGGNSFNEGNAIKVNKYGDIFLTGGFENVANFGATTYTSSGQKDIFVSKLGLSTGINENYSRNDFSFFPNPASDFITIKTEENIEIILSDLQGNTILKNNISNNADVNISGLSKGIYFLTVKNQGACKHKKIIIQ